MPKSLNLAMRVGKVVVANLANKTENQHQLMGTGETLRPSNYKETLAIIITTTVLVIMLY